MFYGEIRIKQTLYYISSAASKDSLQQQIHFDGNIFLNKCYRYNIVQLYTQRTHDVYTTSHRRR